MKKSQVRLSVEEPAKSSERSFARGLMVALPLSLVAWLVILWMA